MDCSSLAVMILLLLLVVIFGPLVISSRALFLQLQAVVVLLSSIITVLNAEVVRTGKTLSPDSSSVVLKLPSKISQSPCPSLPYPLSLSLVYPPSPLLVGLRSFFLFLVLLWIVELLVVVLVLWIHLFLLLLLLLRTILFVFQIIPSQTTRNYFRNPPNATLVSSLTFSLASSTAHATPFRILTARDGVMYSHPFHYYKSNAAVSASDKNNKFVARRD